MWAPSFGMRPPSSPAGPFVPSGRSIALRPAGDAPVPGGPHGCHLRRRPAFTAFWCHILRRPTRRRVSAEPSLGAGSTETQSRTLRAQISQYAFSWNNAMASLEPGRARQASNP